MAAQAQGTRKIRPTAAGLGEADRDDMRPERETIAFACDATDVERLLRGGCGPRTVIVAADVEASLAATDAGRCVVTPFEHLPSSGLADARALEARTWAFWARHAVLDHAGLNVLQMAAFRHVSWIARLTWMSWMAREVLRARQPRRVLVLHEPETHGLDRPPGTPGAPLFSRLVRGVAERMGLDVAALDSPSESGTAARMPPAQVDRATVERVEGPYVLLYGNGPELVHQARLAAHLREALRVRVVQVYQQADASLVAQAAAPGSQPVHEDGFAGALPGVDLGDAARAARQRFDDAAREADAACGLVSGNPQLQCHFDFLFGPYANRLAAQVERWGRVFVAHRPLAVIASYAAPLMDVAAHHGIPCLKLPHGLMTIGQPMQFLTLPAGVTAAAINDVHRLGLVNRGVPERRLIVAGEIGAHGESEERVVAARARSCLRTLLICTGNFGKPGATVHLPYVDWPRAIEGLRRLAASAARRPDVRVIVKMHPRFDHPELHRRISREFPDAARWTLVEHGDLQALAREADMACAWNVLTSALFTLSQAGAPTYQMAKALLDYNAQENGIHEWPHLYSVDELWREFDRLETSEWRERRIRQCREAVDAYLGPPGVGLEQCTRWVHAALREARQPVPVARGGSALIGLQQHAQIG